VLNRCRHIGNSLYYYHLQRWLSYFPLKQLLVLPSEALFADPAQTLSELCRTLKIDSPPPNQNYAKYNAGDYSAVSPAVRHRLNAFYQPYVGKLEALLSQSFAWELSAWVKIEFQKFWVSHLWVTWKVLTAIRSEIKKFQWQHLEFVDTPGRVLCAGP